jgi:hypothetical protein
VNLQDAIAVVNRTRQALDLARFATPEMPIIAPENALEINIALALVLSAMDDLDAYRDALHDLVMCRSEQHAIGGGPGWKGREEKAWRAAEELFEP